MIDHGFPHQNCHFGAIRDVAINAIFSHSFSAFSFRVHLLRLNWLPHASPMAQLAVQLTVLSFVKSMGKPKESDGKG
jgi:hypothetical protein